MSPPTPRWSLWAALWLPLVCVASHAAGQGRMFRYTNEEGRDVFTNHHNLVPKGVDWEQMDLPDLIELDLAQATEQQLSVIDDRVAREHAELQRSPACQEAIVEATQPWWKRALRDHPHWLGIGCLMVLMVLLNRYFAELLPGGTWMRTVMFVSPLLILVGITATVSMKSSQVLASLKRDSALCKEELAPGQGPGATRKRLGSVLQLRNTIQNARERQLAALRQIEDER